MDHIVDNLYIGDQHDATDRGTLEYHDIVYVVTLNENDHRYTTIHHPITDGENPQTEFNRAVEIVRKVREQDENSLIHCTAGISRSVTTVATALAAEDEQSFQTALERVHEQRKVSDPHPKLRVQAEQYLVDNIGTDE